MLNDKDKKVIERIRKMQNYELIFGIIMLILTFWLCFIKIDKIMNISDFNQKTDRLQQLVNKMEPKTNSEITVKNMLLADIEFNRKMYKLFHLSIKLIFLGPLSLLAGQSIGLYFYNKKFLSIIDKLTKTI